MMTKLLSVVALGALILGASVRPGQAHCQIPCGIYDDDARFAAIEEHLRTIEKAMTQIKALSADTNPNMNQIVRWVQAKEDHADEISHITTWYFLTQRVKPVDDSADRAAQDRYLKQLTYLHHMMVYAMKCKQTTDSVNVEKLHQAMQKFQGVYGQ